MKKKIDYQVCYDVESAIEYLNEEEPGEHYFNVRRNWEGAMWDSEEDEVLVYVEEGKVVGIEGYAYVLYPEEETAIRELMAEILAK